MKRSATAVLTMLSAAALGACGDDGNKQATSVVVRTVTIQSAPPAASPSQTTTAEKPDPAPAEPLPEGVVGADGTYTMKVKKSDYEKENLIVDEESPSESEWKFVTTCRGSACSVDMKRELGSGGFKELTLRPVPGRRNVFAGKSTSRDECLLNPKSVATRQRYSIRLHDAVDRNGRRTARRIDAYLTETTAGCSPGTSGALSWRGTLKG